MKRLVIVVLLVFAVVLFQAYDLDKYFSLKNIKSSQAQFAVLYEQHQVMVLGAYFFLYAATAALSLPGAAVLTLAGGALFGFWAGLIIVSFASTIGATLACLVARFLLRDWVQDKFGDKLTTLNNGIQREGAFYLFALRLVPIFPFVMINLLMGLTRMRIWTFYWISQLGMLAGTAVYVNAGKELANVESSGDVLSTSLMVSFIILGLFPITVKKLLAYYRSHRPLLHS